MSRPIRVGAVSYLNARPLYYGLCDLAPDIDLVLEVPSRLADLLETGELDVALIPSIEYLRGAHRGYQIVPGFAIAAQGPVHSVKLFSRVPIARIDRLALDEGSRTSQALVRVWLDARHGVRPATIEPLPLGLPILESTADAVLVIGDRAMQVQQEPGSGTEFTPFHQAPFHEVVDMAEAWRELTGLPFVFALWVTRGGVDLGDLPDTLAQSRRLGLARADLLSRIHGPRLGLDFATCYDYLTRVLSYELGERELAGLARFARMAARLKLAPEGVNFVFYRPRDLASSH